MSTYTARMTRAHNDANILCLGGKTTGEYEALDIVDTWLSTAYIGGRHDISLGLIVPLAIKWEIKMRWAAAWGVFVGALTGVLWSWDWLRGESVNQLKMVPLEMLTIIGLTGLVVALMFYRDPERRAPNRSGIVLSPADGKVVYVKRLQAGQTPEANKKGRVLTLEELTQMSLDSQGYQIGVGMNLLNVHVNRTPIEGRVVLAKHIKGDFLSLKLREAVFENERFVTVIRNGKVHVVVVQIASRLVRRILSYLEQGDIVQMGQRMGMIKFGSQVDVILPLDGVLVKVKPGDQVKAGESIIAEFDDVLVKRPSAESRKQTQT